MIKDFIKKQYHKLKLKRIRAEIDKFSGPKLIICMRKWPYVKDAGYIEFEFECYIELENGERFSHSNLTTDHGREVAEQYLDWLVDKWGIGV